MKNVVKLFVVVIALMMTTELFAQNFGIKAGLNLSKMIAKDDDGIARDDYYKMKPGFHIGATAEFPFSDMLSFETGLLLSTKGYRVSEETLETKLNLLYLDIPLSAKASFDLGEAKIYGVFGPYLGFGLSGKSNYEETIGGVLYSEEGDVEWGSDENESDLKRLDFGLTMGAGVEINSIQIGLTYGLGLADILSYNYGGAELNNRVLGISVGYKFGGQ